MGLCLIAILYSHNSRPACLPVYVGKLAIIPISSISPPSLLHPPPSTQSQHHLHHLPEPHRLPRNVDTAAEALLNIHVASNIHIQLRGLSTRASAQHFGNEV